MQVSKFSLIQLLWPENRYVSDDIEDEQINVFGVQVIVYSSNYLIIPFSVSCACRCTTCLIRVCRLIMGPRGAVDSRRLIHRLIDYVTLAVHTGALFRVRLCGVYTQAGKRRGEYALAVLLPPLSRPSSSPSPPSALASGTGRVWSSQLIRRGAGARCGPRGLSGHNKINSQAHGGHRASRSTDVASASLASSQRIPYCAN